MINLIALFFLGHTAYAPAYTLVEAEVTGYTSSIEETDDTPFLTASGMTVEEGVIACPSRLSFGTKVQVDGIEYECQDRMNSRYRDGEHYDIWFSSREEAIEWGRRKLVVKIN